MVMTSGTCLCAGTSAFPGQCLECLCQSTKGRLRTHAPACDVSDKRPFSRMPQDHGYVPVTCNAADSTMRLRSCSPCRVRLSLPKLSFAMASTPAWKKTSCGEWRSNNSGSHSAKSFR